MRKAVHYIVQPVSARPEVIRRDWGGDFYDYDLDQVEMQALREVLQSTIRSNPFSSFIRGFVASYTEELTWLGEGPGIGREMRRFASALDASYGFHWPQSCGKIER